MAKGLFSQGVALLTDGRTTVKDVKRALVGHKFKVAREVKSHGDWRFSGPSVVIPFRPDVNGYAAVDIVDQPWPDAMGDPKSDPMTFGAWSMGHFGPFAHPGGLSRAVQSARAWGVGLAIPEDPGGFVRIRLSYSFGAKPKAPVLPKNYDPVAEMMFLSRVVVARQDSGASAFNASGIGGMRLGIAASNAYYPSASACRRVMASRITTSLTGSATGNLLSEFWPDVQKLFFRRKHHAGD